MHLVDSRGSRRLLLLNSDPSVLECEILRRFQNQREHFAEVSR